MDILVPAIIVLKCRAIKWLTRWSMLLAQLD